MNLGNFEQNLNLNLNLKLGTLPVKKENLGT
jgi:hypothetical protein